jgi:hypothetical protein
MPDDSRPTRPPRPTPAPAPRDDPPTAAEMDAIRQLVRDIDAGREKLIPWDAAAERWMFEDDA